MVDASAWPSDDDPYNTSTDVVMLDSDNVVMSESGLTVYDDCEMVDASASPCYDDPYDTHADVVMSDSSDFIVDSEMVDASAWPSDDDPYNTNTDVVMLDSDYVVMSKFNFTFSRKITMKDSVLTLVSNVSYNIFMMCLYFTNKHYKLIYYIHKNPSLLDGSLALGCIATLLFCPWVAPRLAAKRLAAKP